MREHSPEDVFLIGFTTYAGEVTAASQWEAPAERKIVRPALKGSWEKVFHETQIPAFLLSLHEATISQLLNEPLLERAIGVIYRPETELGSHYFHSQLSKQFDALVHLDRTRALIPFERTSVWVAGEVPETYPFAV
jgi:erythromycin esterase-like protein